MKKGIKTLIIVAVIFVVAIVAFFVNGISIYTQSCVFSTKYYAEPQRAFEKEYTPSAVTEPIEIKNDIYLYDIDENNITLARMVTLSLLYPVFFKPLTLNKSKIVDGGLFDSFPIGAITDNNLKKIGFQLISKKSKKISTLDYLVDIDTKFIKTLDFRITHNEIARLFDQGYFAAKRIIPIIEKHNKIM